MAGTLLEQAQAGRAIEPLVDALNAGIRKARETGCAVDLSASHAGGEVKVNVSVPLADPVVHSNYADEIDLLLKAPLLASAGGGVGKD